MQIKSYNRAVDPNTIQGQVQAPNNINAFGGNTAGQEQLTKGLGAVQAQVQGYIDDQINMGVIEASNKYHQGLNDLLNNPDTGLLTKQNVNALDVMKQYQEGEAKIRQETLGSLPNYQKAHDAFTRMADDTNLSKLGTIMQYQYKKTEEYRQDTLNTALSNIIEKIIEGKDMNSIYKGFQQNLGLIYSTYGHIYGKDKMDQMIKTANTNMAIQVIQNALATGDESSYENGYNILQKISPFIDDAAATKLKTELFTRKRDNEKLNLAAQAYKLFPNDPKKRREWIASQNTVTTYSGGGAPANTETPLMNTLGNAISAKIMQNTGKYIPAGWIAAQLSMESAKGTSLAGNHNYGGRKLEDGSWANYDSDDAFVDNQAKYLAKYAENGIFDAKNLTDYVKVT